MNAAMIAGEVALVAISAAASWFDLRYRRLPNWLCACALLAGITFVAAMGGWASLSMALLHFVVALVGGIALFALGAIGAGDAKFYASLAAWLPVQRAPLLIGAIALAGLLLLVVWLPVLVRRRRRPAPDDDPSFGKLPYGVAIALGAVVTVATTY